VLLNILDHISIRLLRSTSRYLTSICPQLPGHLTTIGAGRFCVNPLHWFEPVSDADPIEATFVECLSERELMLYYPTRLHLDGHDVKHTTTGTGNVSSEHPCECLRWGLTTVVHHEVDVRLLGRTTTLSVTSSEVDVHHNKTLGCESPNQREGVVAILWELPPDTGDEPREVARSRFHTTPPQPLS
jgi:hypothetical protein